MSGSPVPLHRCSSSSARSSHEIRWPMLIQGASIELPELDYTDAADLRRGQWLPTMNICKAMLGVAILTLPFSGSQLGYVCSLAIITGMALATHTTLRTMCRYSDAIITCTHTYAVLVSAQLSPLAGALLQACLLLNVWGINVVYLQVMMDVLIGRLHSHSWSAPSSSTSSHLLSSMPEQLTSSTMLRTLNSAHPHAHLEKADGMCTGLVCPVLGYLPDALQTRDGLLVLVVFMVIIPLSQMRSMTGTGVISAIGVAAMSLLTLVVIALVVVGAVNGTLHPLPTWPALDYNIGFAAEAVRMINLASAFLCAFVCQQNIHSVRFEMGSEYSLTKMTQISAKACTLCAVLYAVITLAGMSVFGPAVAGDMLHDMGALSLRVHGFGPWVAGIIAAVLQLSMLLSMLGSYCVMMWPLRIATSELIFGVTDLTRPQFTLLTLSLVMSTAMATAALRNVEIVVQLIGATASNAVAFVFPALIMLQPHQFSMQQTPVQRGVEKGIAYALLVIAVLLFFGGITRTAIAL